MRDAARIHAPWRAANGQQTPPTKSWSDERPAASALKTLVTTAKRKGLQMDACFRQRIPGRRRLLHQCQSGNMTSGATRSIA